ncbi:putative nucleotidyltransferase, Ribonuclease H [Helianthus annuus]|uniref:uncharacterized protein LOC110888170 n=1 Tax=Helianthus annuus TaxID=4232 RepID=UPI000B906E7D|nr:uncharacterized protein LOC110888170 [Helianthus annuus]KAJ0909268.1 putative nucleotidyltransferase, Ribonuclease H [Helianthus annuus]
MTGIPRSLTEHRLNTFTWVKPVKQKKRSMGPNKKRVACEETRKLLRAEIVREVKYPSWVANPVMVQKKDGGWRMCIDFQDLNKACPKDCYPLPEIDTQVDSLSQYPLKCFLDAYKGYHQIQMSIEDKEKTAFITDEGTFCYTKMPFGLKNAGATYQRFMNTLFREQRGRNLEVYVDDIVIKSLTEAAMIDDIAETLNTMQDVNMKLNPGKCCFGVEEGNFLGVVVTKGGIKANPEKTQAVAEMRSPRSLKDIQQLNGRLIALNRFLSKVADKTLPFMKVLKDCLQTSKFNWTTEAEIDFQEMKTYICKLPTLATPVPGDPLLLYLSASKTTISAVMMVERERKQIPIYFISRTLKGPEEWYMPLEKLALALVFASRRLRRYFQGHKVTLVTDQPLQKVLRKPKQSGRLAKWAVELGEHSLEFKPRTAMKGQILADFLAEVPEDEERELLRWEALEEEEKRREDAAVWKLFTDGASSEEGNGAGITLISPERVELTYAIRLDFENTNNTAEYEALLAGMRLAQKMKAKHVEASTDSQLVVKQYQGEYEAKDGVMARYVAKVKETTKAFGTFKLEYIPRGRNRKSDALSKLASVAFDHLAKEVKVEVLTSPSLNVTEVATIEGSQETWMTPIIKFLRDGILPEGEWAARKIRVKALQYELIGEELYRRSYLGPSLKCIDMEEAEYVIREMHEGICGMHSGPRTVVRRAMNAGFYWPRMYETTSEEIKKCDNCQVHAPMTHQHKHPMVPVSTSWPFQKWAIDIIGPFPEGPGGVKYVVVAIDYFTKWIETKPLAKITGDQMRRFVLDNIVCRYGVPKELVSDNGVQFAGRPFKPWYEQMRIQQVFTSVTHAQSNGLVERANQSVIKGTKGRLGRKQKGWLEELPFVLWAYRTTLKCCNGETLFSLTYGTEAIIPAEIGSQTARMKLRDEENEQDLRMKLNLLEERREIAAVKEAHYKKLLASYYNTRMKKLNLVPGDLVLRANEASLQENTRKLGPN